MIEAFDISTICRIIITLFNEKKAGCFVMINSKAKMILMMVKGNEFSMSWLF